MFGRNKLNIPERKLIIVFGDTLVIGFFIYFFLFYVLDSNFQSEFNSLVIIILGYLTYFSLSYVLDYYYLGSQSLYSSRTIVKGIIIAGVFTLTLLIYSLLLLDASFWRINLIVFLIGTPIMLYLWRKLFFYIFKFIPTTKEVSFIYDSKLAYNWKNDILTINGSTLETHYRVIKSTDVSNYSIKILNELTTLENTIDTWVVNLDSFEKLPKDIETVLLDSLVKGKEVLTFNSFYENVYEALPIISHNASDSCSEIMQLRHNRVRYVSQIFSFFTNAFLSLMIGIFFLITIPFVSFFNLFFNKGPLFYSQKRIGKGGTEFDVLKFRSMVIDAEKKGAQMATKNDSRITSFGRLLRKFRIDELPQIISVFRGNMLFIGPRPERKVYVDQLNKLLPYYNIRHIIKPGITGWAQVKYKYGENLEDSIQKLEYDLYYIKNRSISLDLRIIFKTFTTILFSRGL